ncbi:hypothetical protein N8K70_14825 [Microbacterium betulae]|uniref:DUF559 domain-containing protein n=1 Tax=Microbacterium betulae TaxID=2981139 RepID=A0AA97I6Q3_9MICO|nr:hypothetical protein [Microbacterium sp. AB]WOF22650.1 hypothetical protein N8K70_14825 [Microbacterium sp. AB]
MRSPRLLPRRLAGRAFAVRDAAIARGRLRRSDLAAPFAGVRVPIRADAALGPSDIDDDPWRRLREIALARAEAFSTVLPDGAVYSHHTAAHAHDLPLPRRHMDDLAVHVSVRTQAERRRRAGVAFHLVPPGRQRVHIVGGLPVTTAVDTWCALAGVLRVPEIVAMGDALVRRKRPLATMDELAEAVRRHRGRHGAKALRVALALIRPRTDSPAETELRLAIHDAALPEPEVNVWVLDGRGRRIRLGDLVYRRERILVEYDGPHHFTDPAQQQKDIDALDAAVAAGWRVIRVTNVHRRQGFAPIIRRLRDALRERRASL